MAVLLPAGSTGLTKSMLFQNHAFLPTSSSSTRSCLARSTLFVTFIFGLPFSLSLSLSLSLFTLTLTHNHTQTTLAHFFHFLSLPSLNCSFHRTHTFTISFKLSLIHSPSPAHSFILSLILLSCSYIRIFSLLLSPLSPRNFSPFLPRVFLSHTHFTFTQSLAQFSLSFVASPIKAELQFPHLQLSLNDDDLRLSDSSMVLRQFSGK